MRGEGGSWKRPAKLSTSHQINGCFTPGFFHRAPGMPVFNPLFPVISRQTAAIGAGFPYITGAEKWQFPVINVLDIGTDHEFSGSPGSPFFSN